ncbi:MAG: hypothetical protein WCK27_31180, partial [Verrucomicrobiota bacterium]
ASTGLWGSRWETTGSTRSGDVRMRPAAPGCEDYAGAERGLMSCDDDGALTTTNETEERLVFAERGTA